jgi:hypothetical protein
LIDQIHQIHQIYLTNRRHRARAALRMTVMATVVAVTAATALTAVTVASVANSTVAGAAVPQIAPHVYQGGGVITYGDAQLNSPSLGPALSSVMVGMAADPAPSGGTQGYWLVAADGGVFAEGSAGFYGSTGALRLNAPVVGMAPTPDGRGYWLVALDGGIFSFGDAAFYGSMGGSHLNKPVVGMAATPDGRGYWLVAQDGGIFTFGDAAFYGSMGGSHLNAPISGMAASATGHGYWLVAADGGIFTFGDAPFLGSMGGTVLNDPVVDMVATPHNGGYLMVATDGEVFHFGNAGFYGSLAGGYGGDPTDVPPIAAIALTPDDQGYWLLEPDGWSYGFTNPPSPAATATTSAIVSIANSQVNSDPDKGRFCNPYGPCEEWCSLFATWVWERAGVNIPEYPFTGNIYNWAAAHTAVLPPTGAPLPGDAVLYGTSPFSTATSVHVGLVVQVWPDGAIVTIEGDAGPAPSGSLAVVVNGPYLPSQSVSYNGVPIYAFARP